MQVARILDPHSRSALGKLKQVLRALQLEAHLSKDEILTLYLDHAPFGGTIEGVEAASWAYLGKPAARLSHAEAALLAVLPQAPSRLRPDRNAATAQRYRDKLLARKIRVHGNFIEHVPLALLVLALLESCGLAAPAVWSFGGLLLLARLLHAAGLSRSGGYSVGRFWGTALTWLAFLLMALAGLWLALR